VFISAGTLDLITSFPFFNPQLGTIIILGPLSLSLGCAKGGAGNG